MSDFLEILTHGRRLQGAVKELSIAELEAVQDKLASIVEKRKEKEVELQKAEQEKQAKIAEIQRQMEEAGVNVDDLKSIAAEAPKKATGKKRPVKYKLTDADGNTHPWTGIGRMPKVYKAALDSGKSLDEFAV